MCRCRWKDTSSMECSPATTLLRVSALLSGHRTLPRTGMVRLAGKAVREAEDNGAAMAPRSADAAGAADAAAARHRGDAGPARQGARGETSRGGEFGGPPEQSGPTRYLLARLSRALSPSAQRALPPSPLARSPFPYETAMRKHVPFSRDPPHTPPPRFRNGARGAEPGPTTHPLTPLSRSASRVLRVALLLRPAPSWTRSHSPAPSGGAAV